ncbi:uncharacterized protein LOC132300084 [Cornus florida]|uniref:uncharacterized protein LOC132300084 n=1 Tax=Cornus florida TaxID=4283 RepID=UPI0028988711|nr:uncharacterized protein LOC132300084 [Cornus florida]
MSRREGRESDSRRHRSRFDREPSPKRSRRDGKPATERLSINPDLDTGNHSNRDEKHHRRLQDALPLEVPVASDSKVETGALSKESDKKTNGHSEGTKNSLDPAEVPRPRTYFQHDERGNAAQVGRSFSRRAATERGWSDSKDRHSERVTNRSVISDTQQKDEKPQARKADERVWRHDGFFEVEADPQPPARKRPSFRERKIPADSENTEKTGTDTVKPGRPDHSVLGSERKEERGGNKPRPSDRSEKTFEGDRDANREETRRGGFPPRDRYGGGGNYRGRERFNGRRGYYPGGVRVEKWKHDLFDEANRSPSPKKEEDQIAKVEALLLS